MWRNQPGDLPTRRPDGIINCNSKERIRFILTVNRAGTVRKLTLALVGIEVYSFIVVHLIELLNLSSNSHIKNFSLMHTLLSFVISMLLVFRTNTAYDGRGRPSLVGRTKTLGISGQ